ncbi:MAG: methyltransferase [Planctomycetes bacterium]|nr:methyltransferase [Planctomycetota bacterium]
MTDESANRDRTIRDHYERVWSAGDAWSFETSDYERERLDFLSAAVADRHYRRALEIGCGAGALTERLEEHADELLAIDVADAAIIRARRRLGERGRSGRVTFLAANAMTHDFAGSGPWDLIVLAETIYCLGWLYPVFDIGMLALALAESLAPGGRLLLANTFGAERDWLLRPFLILTYRDLFLNVGLERERETEFTGTKDGEAFRVLVSLLRRRSASGQG